MLMGNESKDSKPGALIKPSLFSQLSLEDQFSLVLKLSSTNSTPDSDPNLLSQSILESGWSTDSRSGEKGHKSPGTQCSLNSESSLQSGSTISSILGLGSVCQEPGVREKFYSCNKVTELPDGHASALVFHNGTLYAGSSSSEIRLFETPELELIESFQKSGDQGAVKSLLILHDRVYSAHQDHKIRAWEASKEEINTHKKVATLPTMKNILITFLPAQNYVQIRRHKKTLWIQHADTVSALASCPDGAHFYSASWDKSFKLWRISDLQCVESVQAHDDAINSLVVSKQGYVYTASADSKIKVWERSTKKKHSLLATLEGHKSAVNALELSPDGNILYSGSTDRHILVWEREESAGHMSLLGPLRGHRQAVLSLASTSNILCSGSADKTIRIWKRNPHNMHSCLAVLQGHRGPVKSLSVSQDLKSSSCHVYSAGLDRTIRSWVVSTDDDAEAEKIVLFSCHSS